MEIGRRLRELRKGRRMSLYDVEARIGLHFSTIGKYERGERRPSVQVLRELATVYQVTLGDILDGGDDDLPAEAVTVLLQRDDLRRLLAAARRLTPAQVAALVGLLDAVLPPPRGALRPGREAPPPTAPG